MLTEPFLAAGNQPVQYMGQELLQIVFKQQLMQLGFWDLQTLEFMMGFHRVFRQHGN
jgi:hypothetical protein